MSEERNLTQSFEALFNDLENDYLADEKPLLAHYTTVQTLEKILLNNELWMANPLFMNDHEELRWGIQNGVDEFYQNEAIRSYLEETNSLEEFSFQVNWQLEKFDKEQAFDTYIFCLSRHTRGDQDGKLSMWRGYGAQGDGVAIVFDTSKMPQDEESPLLVAPVAYASHADRHKKLKELADHFARIISEIRISGRDEFFQAVYWLFERLKLFAIYTKHEGFIEEQEWRVVYMPHRDTEKLFHDRRHYITNGRGVEPKLRLKFGRNEPGLHPDLNFDELVHEIILGPSHASILAEKSIKRMVELLKRDALVEKIRASGIPFRRQ